MYRQQLGSHASALIENNGVGAADGVPLRKRLIAAHKEATKLARKASTQYRSSKYRVARKGGWGCSSYRDVQRSPNEHDEDDM